MTVLRIAALALVLGGCVSVVPDAQKVAVGPPVALSVALGPADALELHVPTGEVTVRGVRGREASATLKIRCPENSTRCREWAQDVDFKAVRVDGALRLGLKQPSRTQASVTLDVRVPADVPLSVFMKYGDLRIDGVERGVRVRMKAGSVALEMPRRSVREAHLAARFGDASLRVRDGTLDGRRPTLVGASLDWTQGTGLYDVDARVRYGDIDVTLYP